MSTINVKIREAYDTEQNWSSKNPILLAGQLAYSSDKYGKYKIGDGTKTWSQLDYVTSTPSSHTHDDRYYTESEIDSKLSTKANATTVTSHTGNSTVHVTSTDKNNWNNKSQISIVRWS